LSVALQRGFAVAQRSAGEVALLLKILTEHPGNHLLYKPLNRPV
jgi:hypothetical protein